MEKQFHGTSKQHSYFEGWYLKHQNQTFSIAFIPAYHIDKNGKKEVSIQVITNEFSESLTFPHENFHADLKKFSVSIGENHFSSKGLRISIKTKNYQVEGNLKYGPFTVPTYPLMGPFRLIPFMQCNHGILSLYHSVSGYIKINDRMIRFDHDMGYIEKDWGTSFPKSYLWTHCMNHSKDRNAPLSIMVSIAHIPFGPISFTGCIASLCLNNKEYRLATYKGVKVLIQTSKKLILKQGKYKLCIYLKEGNGQNLKAPLSGQMSRIVKENITSNVRYQFMINNICVLDMSSPYASYERGKKIASADICRN